MAVNLTNADAALKSYYIDVVAEQLNTKINPFMAQIEQTTNNVWGKDVKKAISVGLNGGIGAGDEDGSLPTAYGNEYLELTSTLKNLYGTIEISDKAIRASENNAGALVNLLNAEMEGLIKASSYNFGRMLYGDGSGKIALITAGQGNMAMVDDMSKLAIGQVVEVVDGSGKVLSNFGKMRIKELSKTENLVTFTTSALGEEELGEKNYYLAIQGSSNKEITGLGAIFGDYGELYGQDKETNKTLVPIEEYLSGSLTLDKLQEVLDKIEITSGNTANIILCSVEVRRILQKLLSANNRNVETMELNGGYKTMSYNGIPIVADRFCPKTHMYILNTNDFALHQLCDWQWLSDDDGRVLKQVPGKPVYTATLVKYAELMCSNPAGQARIVNITK